MTSLLREIARSLGTTAFGRSLYQTAALGRNPLESPNKLVGTDATSIGAVDASGMGAGKDLTINVEKYTVVRVVFKDGVLVLFKVWPVMDQSAMAGGMLLRR